MEVNNILIVDDDEDIRNLFRKCAEKFNVQTMFASDGMEAFQKFTNQEFELVITDLKMPKMNGIEFIKRVRELPRKSKFPFMIITSNIKEFELKIAMLEQVNVLEKFVRLNQTKNEIQNKLEQLRALDNDLKISVALAESSSIGVDTEEDYLAIKKIMEYKR